jgi:hypothetical protein
MLRIFCFPPSSSTNPPREGKTDVSAWALGDGIAPWKNFLFIFIVPAGIVDNT